MTRLKTIAHSTLVWIGALAAFGLFASVGLVVLGALALLGLSLAVIAWISQAFDAKPTAAETTA